MSLCFPLAMEGEDGACMRMSIQSGGRTQNKCEHFAKTGELKTPLLISEHMLDCSFCIFDLFC